MATKYVSLGSITRKGNKFTVKHTVKKSHQDEIDHAHVQWIVVYGSKDETIDKKSLSKSGGESSITVTRSKAHPVKGGQTVAVMARAIGRKGGKDKGGWSETVTFVMEEPKKPSVTKSVSAEDGKATFTIKTEDPDTGKRERYDTRWTIKREANVGTKSSVDKGTSTSGSFTKTVNPAEAKSLGYGEYVKMTLTATARGMGGDSAPVSKSHVFSRPNRPVIKRAELGYADPNDPAGGIVTVSFDLKSNSLHPVDSVQLWRLQSTSVTTAAEAANAGGWDPVDGADGDGNEKALTDNAESAVSTEAGTHVWYRVEAKHDDLTAYSDPVECTGAYTSKSTTTTGTVTITHVSVGEDFAALTLHDTETDDDVIRVTWSDYEDAWYSNEEPDSFDVTWADGGDAVVYVKGLEPGTRYWFRARAVDIDADGGEVPGGLSAAVSATPAPDFGPIAVSVPQNVPTGSDMTVSWSFTGGYAQDRAWVVMTGTGWSTQAAYVEGSGTSAVVPWEDFLEWHEGEVVSVSVTVISCGAYFFSEHYGVVIDDLPTCGVTAPTLTAQPAVIGLATDSPNSPTATVAVTSHGTTGSGLDGDSWQMDGDCVWSGTVDCDWSESSNGYTASVELPDGLAFWEGAVYTASVALHDPVTGLDSETAEADFDVEWAHQAGVPTGTATADAESLSATVTVDAPDSYEAGDRFDLYRVTADGERRIASQLPFGASVTDALAPFGAASELRYMAVTRTPDGDWEPSAPLSYQLPHKALRFDWNGSESLSLPYNIEESLSYSKGFESEAALDGESIGWWDGGIGRTSSLKTDMVKVESAEQREAIASLARFAGPVFVRTPMGQAFPANVVPSDIGTAYDTAAVSVSFNCEETALTDEHRPSADDIALPEWGGGALEVHGTTVYDAAGGFPMDDWAFVGSASSATYYVCDPDGTVRNQAGTEMPGYTWDGTASITSANGTIYLDGSPR